MYPEIGGREGEHALSHVANEIFGRSWDRSQPKNKRFRNINIFIREAPSQHVILHCIHPSFLWPPSLSLSLYSHLSHHSNIFLPISPAYMFKKIIIS